ncbi:TIGR04283 family arsenosugar biosynthesis glycosyltransferase [Pleurocapsa sp. PCC 7319]|uniref:TIGR04283 family arsenosugar biosynthesis glycosyltransferase n=1 Tax=Pleurocapsa sp. PCC 7319 TaxID=118161 RepID=UPI000346A4E4|nr:TIGR04283 family arsenosugar biosynthesis glycosyltransferase [Pleurocapsa sp. PCC 7319]
MAKDIISIIIPVLNEAAIIQTTLRGLQRDSALEIIVVDGGSVDETVTLAQQMGVRVISLVGRGRAAQMNAGANIAQGEILLFLHIDTQLPPDFDDLVSNTLEQPDVIAGAFELTIDGAERSLRWIEMLVKMRSHLFSLPYGDQAIFITKQVFKDMGGYSDLPIMEDFEFIKRLKRQGKIALAPGAVTTSSRRWQKLGVWKTTLINQLIIIGYYLGVSPTKLSNFYRSQKCNKNHSS